MKKFHENRTSNKIRDINNFSKQKINNNNNLKVNKKIQTECKNNIIISNIISGSNYNYLQQTSSSLNKNRKKSSAENGNEGIEKLKSSNYDLIFIDFNLPDMGGDQVLSKIKENGSNCGKSVLMSGDENLEAEFENKGFMFFLHKPIKKSEFKKFAAKI